MFPLGAHKVLFERNAVTDRTKENNFAGKKPNQIKPIHKGGGCTHKEFETSESSLHRFKLEILYYRVFYKTKHGQRSRRLSTTRCHGVLLISNRGNKEIRYETAM